MNNYENSKSRIWVNPAEAANYSWALNVKKNICVKCFLAVGAFFGSLVFYYKIKIVDIEKLMRSDFEKYVNSFFVRSLEKRGIAIIEPLKIKLKEEGSRKKEYNEKCKREKCKRRAELMEVEKKNLPKNLQKYENYFKVAVDGIRRCGKSTFINEMIGVGYSHADAAPVQYDSKKEFAGRTDFFKLNESIVLCELPEYVQKEHFSEKNPRFDNFDVVIILVSALDIKEVESLVRIAKESKKPYLIVMNQADSMVDNYRMDTGKYKIEGEVVVAEKHNVMLNNLKLNYNDIMPSNGKPLIIGRSIDKYDFREIDQLIRNKSFKPSSETQ